MGDFILLAKVRGFVLPVPQERIRVLLLVLPAVFHVQLGRILPRLVQYLVLHLKVLVPHVSLVHTQMKLERIVLVFVKNVPIIPTRFPDFPDLVAAQRRAP